MADESMDGIIEEFLVESAENLDQLDADLVALESDPTSRELLASVFRAIHTVKGVCGFLGFSRLEELAHVGESLLGRLRDGALVLDGPRTSALLETVDTMRALLAVIEATGSDVDSRDLSELVGHLRSLTEPDPAAPAEVKAPENAAPTPAEAAPAEAAEVRVATESTEIGVPRVPEPDVSRMQAPVPATSAHRAAPVELPAGPAPESPDRSPGTRDDSRPVALHALPDAPSVQATPAPIEAPEPRASANERSVRVDVELLNALMRQVDELVLARNQMLALVGDEGDEGVARTVQRLSTIVSELQEVVMTARMQPVDHLLSKLPRMVREVARQCAKEVVLHIDSGGTELDRSLLEAIRDPMSHLLRNAVDHGIELPERRVELGKPREGSIELRAFQEDGQVVFEMTDDGAGIDPEKVRAKALENGIVTHEHLARMTEHEVVDLVFQPGFSTAAAVTNISGRGVGMDVVRTNIERLGGSVDLASRIGAGTTVRIRIPLTLAVIPALLIGCRGEHYAVPLVGVDELVRLDGREIGTGVESVDGTLLYRLRGRLLPLVRLDQEFGFAAVPLESRDAIDIVVVRVGTQSFGIVVDSVDGIQEIVVKPLSARLRHIPVFAGVTILGDGGVALILDIPGLARVSGIQATHPVVAAVGASATTMPCREARPLLLVRAGAQRRIAVPLDQVVRLEEIPSGSVEHAGSRRVVQYEGRLLPLVWLEELLGVAVGGGGDTLQVVVCRDGSRTVGLVATEILDTALEVVDVDEAGAGPFVLGTIVVHGAAADLLDLSDACSYLGTHAAEGLRATSAGADTRAVASYAV